MLTPEAIALMKEKGVWLVPQAYLFESMDPATLPAPVRRKFEQLAPLAKASQEQAIRAGVRIAFSTDGPLEKNDPWREFQALVRRGMTPVQAIQSATSRAAELLQLTDRGALAPGLIADVIGIAGDPTVDISAMENVRFVMRRGSVVRRP